MPADLPSVDLHFDLGPDLDLDLDPDADDPPGAGGAPPAAPAAASSNGTGAFVERIRELTELYRAGVLDDEEFAAAKAIVLRGTDR